MVLLLTACLPSPAADLETDTPVATITAGPSATPIPTRPPYDPGQLVDYTAQNGDTLPALVARFNTSLEEILAANPDIPANATTMPPGMPMKIPIYYLQFWGTSYKILPDSLFINGPAAIGFDTETFVNSQPGWLKDYTADAANNKHSGAEVVDIVATNYSISPRILLAVLEYQTGALSQPVAPSGRYILGHIDYTRAGFYLQLIWAANALNNGFYGWRTGQLIEFQNTAGTILRPDPWQTASSVAFQYYYSRLFTGEDFNKAIGPEGIALTYQKLFGNPWLVDVPHIPVSLQQPPLVLPFPAGETWSLAGGPHTGWGSLFPWAALDFSPPVDSSGCLPTYKVTIAMANGVVVRSETGVVMLDLDGDGDERTGWVLLYLHVATAGRASVGRVLHAGDPVGYPSCEGGTASDVHVHIARKYNGEWIPADSAIPFNMEGWIPHNSQSAYDGTLTRGNQVVIACGCTDFTTQITAGK